MKLFKIMALTGLLAIALTGAASAETFIIEQDGVSWVPSEMTINLGDTIEWHWNSLSHTVTSGEGPDDGDAGMLFDEPLDAGNPVVSYTFDAAGDYPFFCRPHFALGMTGVIHVEDSVASENRTWGAVKGLFR
jgi:plastocyanin